MNVKYRMFFVVLLVFCLLGVMVLAGYSESEETKFKTVTVGLNSYPVTVDPFAHRDRNTQAIIRNWNDGLKQSLPNGSHVLDVAESITQLNPVTYEIKIKQGVTFHNGDPMTADDYVFSIKRMNFEGAMEGVTSPRSGMAGEITSAEKVDDYTVIVKLGGPIDMSKYWYAVEILPKKYFEEVGIEGYIKHPIGIGPFKWIEGDLKTQIVLERYENYHGCPPEMPGEVVRVPALDRVIFVFIPEATTRVAALLSGEIDIIQSVPIDSVKLIQDNPDTRIEKQTGSKLRAIWFNTKKPPFNNKRVRQAIAYAIDYDLLIKQLFLGYAEPLKGLPFLGPYKDSPLYGQYTVKSPYDYNPEKAKALLKEAGVSGFSTIIDTTLEDSTAGQAIAQMLNDIGIDASVRVWEKGVIREEFPKGERDILLHNWGNASRLPTWARNVVATGQRGNLGSYSNPTLDDLIVPANNMENSLEQYAMLNEAFGIIIEELPVLSLYCLDTLEACRNNVKNFYPHIEGKLNLHKVDIE